MGCAASTGPLYRDEHDFATTAAYYDKDEDVKKDWVENEQLGEGMFARVVKVTRKSTNQQYACKVLRKTTVIEDNEIKLAPKASDLLREIDCLRRVGGAKGCLKLCGVVESPSELRLVMELCAGSLLDYVHDLDQFDERFAALYASQLLEAVAYHLVRLGERVHLPDVGRRRLPGVRLAVQRRFGRRRPLGPRPRRGPQLGRRDRHRAGRPRRGARGARLRLVVAAPKVPHVHPHLHRSA
ncbi:unnamed protein product [Pelagomonas calceolata]|uniref:Protein kinase domain-containing protein n=1 Tax=Pelagomonas calceolata TaxID=35677 RepID=A0A8J2SNL0_9STRA|nr:unnamed protein product [Pelagomonas calceolata]|mmetsp:Transcript_21714/g.61143  ORF Transcript_21714/g.61143 Transcript_21714/m.61143 type:complete len:240 (+) Transcript_21714:455-1174(+)